MGYEHLGQGVYHLDSGYINPGVASLYCVVHNDEVAIVETGTANSLQYVEALLQDLSLAANKVKYVIPTHVHLDHAGGAGVMMRAFPEARLVIHPRGARHMIDPQKLVAAAKAVYGEETFTRLYGEIPPIDESRVITAEHETTIKLNDREFIIIDTPGHAYHHFCVVDPFSQGIFTGDTFGLSYTNLLYRNQRFIIPTTTPTQFDPQALHQSNDLLMSFKPSQMYLTHFNRLPNPAALVDQHHAWIDKYVELTEQVKPMDDDGLTRLKQEMGQLLKQGFELTDEVIQGQLAMDIDLNSQGLAYWYQKRNSG